MDLISEAENQGMQIYWGTKGFSLRLEIKNGEIISLFYGYPPGSNESVVTNISGYVGYIEDLKLQSEIRQKFLSVEGTNLAGKYTVYLEINKNNIETGRQLVKKIWEIIHDPRIIQGLPPKVEE